MKRIVLFITIAALISTGCTKKFDSINTNPSQASAANFDPNLLLPQAENGYMSAITGYSGPILFQSLWVQTFADAEYPAYYTNGDKYVASGNILTYDASTWNNAYGAASRAHEIINLTKDNEDHPNLRGVAMIMQILNLQVVTDVYGDIPYFQALEAKNGISLPLYDKQEDIYPAMLNSLDSVIATLDPSKDKPSSDLIFNGDINKWKKFGNSLLLRMAMRLTKVDMTTAQKYAEKAFQGGTMAGNGDNAYIAFDHADGYNNPNISALVTAEDYSQVRWGKKLIDMLKASGDPRLTVISEVPQPGKANAGDQTLDGDATAAKQQGMPNGYDQNGGATDISKAPDYPGPTGTGDDANPIGAYSRPTTSLYIDYNTPGFIMTYAESELLLAEAAVYGWNVGASAAEHYANGLSAALQTYGTLNGTTPISAATADSYAASNPLDVSSTDKSLQQINEQIWITTGTLFNFEEAWINWRRSGYPVLIPVNYTGNFTNGQIPRRQIYPESEATNNPANYKTAVAGLSGGDNWTSRVWWDK